MKKDKDETQVEDQTSDAPTTDAPKTEAEVIGVGGFGGVSPYGQ